MGSHSGKPGRSFGWLNATQFLGALNDNIFKLLIVLFLIERQGLESATRVSAVAMGVFVVPFLIFSAFAGKLADRFSKRNIVVTVKVVELAVMTIGCVAFILEAQIVLYVVLFMMATQSAFFGPAKYGIVPELVGRERVPRANSFLEALTYLAIVIGIGSAPLLTQVTGEHYGLVSLLCVGIAGAGLVVSVPIERTQAAGGGRGASIVFVRDIYRTLARISSRRDLFSAVLASAYFLLIAGFIHINVIPYAMQRLGLDQMEAGYLFIPAAIGIGAGALWAGRLSGRSIEFGVIPVGALGLTISSMGLGLIDGGLYFVLIMLFLMGTSAGLFIVPVHAFIQISSPARQRGQILASSSFLGWTGVLLSAVLLYVFDQLLGMSAAQVFALLGAMTLVLAIVTIIMLPDFLVRFLVVMLTRLCYRITVKGCENVPSTGGALVVCNHASWIDPFIIAAAGQRRIRFVMDRVYYNKRWLRPICRLMRSIPVAASDPPKKVVAALREARAAMDAGFIVCIFAEGAMTRTGMLRAFKSGFERVMRGSSYKIIPAYLGGTWGSIFSYYAGRPLSTLPRKVPYPVSICFGEPMPSDSTAAQIRQKVRELSCDYFEDQKASRGSLTEHFIQAARRHWLRGCVADCTGKRLNYGQALVSTVAISAELGRRVRGQERIGVLLPPSVGAVLANLAVGMLGKVVVNLNYGACAEVRESAMKGCEIKSIITSRSIVEKVESLEALPGLIFLEDVIGGITKQAKVKAYLKARLMPRRLLANARGFCGDDLATVIFSSGSTGQPKGVMLSHHNILSNIQTLQMVFHIRDDDNLCGVLPFFHSFGFTCTLWLPLVIGVSAIFASNPLDGELVARGVRENRASILFAAPTFLLNYIRKAKREDFASLREVVVGAEKLKRKVADSFEAGFGLRPLEGYGATELSPVVSLNLRNVDVGGVYQVGNKGGTVGHPIPGMAVKVVDVESKKPLPAGTEGLLMVKGPNVMLGYLNMKEETDEVLRDGWYNTGDIASVDEDGFLTITDRLSRFSKIGGEMVPHLGVEQAYLEGLGTHEQVVAVTSVPEPKKGEELVVLYLEKAADAERLHEIITNSELPNMWKPRRNNYFEIKSMPALGPGKLDVMQLRKIALAVKNSIVVE